MTSSPTNTLRKSLMALMAVSAVAMVAVPVAGATITTTNITATTIKTWDMADRTDGRDLPINERTFSGTVDAAATAGDNVAVRCFDPITGDRIGLIGTAYVTAAKKWSMRESIGGLSSKYCRIAAVPASHDEAITAAELLNKYKGSKVVSIGYWERNNNGLGGAPGNEFSYDYEFALQSRTISYSQTYSIGDCGLCGSKLRNPADGAQGANLWSWNSSNWDAFSAFPTEPSTGSTADPLMLVDGNLAVDAYMMSQRARAEQDTLRYGPSGGITVSYSINQTNGDVTINESQPLYRCLDQIDPSNWRNCEAATQTGVRMNRVITMTADLTIWRSADTYVSTDGKAHSVRATYVNQKSGHGYRYGTTGAYAALVKGDKSGAALGVVAKNAYSVLGVKSVLETTEIGYNYPVGDIVMSPRPAMIRILDNGPTDGYVYARWSLPIAKKGKSVTVKQAYTIAASDVNLTRLRTLAIAGLAK